MSELAEYEQSLQQLKESLQTANNLAQLQGANRKVKEWFTQINEKCKNGMEDIEIIAQAEDVYKLLEEFFS